VYLFYNIIDSKPRYKKYFWGDSLALKGKTAAVTSDTFTLTKMPAGRYLVEVRRSGARVGTTAVMVR
jgi:hypothetical protein